MQSYTLCFSYAGETAIQEGGFREDLYYRTAVITINLPPLREREGDIMLLANFFLKRFAWQLNKKIRGFSPASISALESYEWPGNVRELENKLHRAVIMSDSSLLEPESLGFTEDSISQIAAATETMTLKDARDKVERELIAATLRNQGGSISKAAEMLGVSRPTLYDLMKKHGI